ncbi:MAG: hypothetical protein ACJ8AT_05410 [Hyalangium sp.]|uniref:hypothetical protein n=1 Tax=Hyalangium sp. TaxID=2028555 RepID=UPI00389AAD5E
MRRFRFLAVLFALGTVGGYASGFASLSHHSQCRRAWMEERAAQTCAPCPASTVAPAPSRLEAPVPSRPEAPAPANNAEAPPPPAAR